MSFQRLFTTVVLGALSFGCVATPPVETDEVDEQAQALGGDPGIFIISTNSLLPGTLMDATNQAYMADLAGGPLSASTPLTDLREGRTLLAYIATCALGDDESVISVASDSTAYRFAGHLGLARGWAFGAISASDQRWISACLLAHANAYGQPVQIDVRGNHPALEGHDGAGFDQQEAAFYGDLFQGGDAFACIGSSPSHPDGDPQRICGRTEECRFTITGTCAPGSLDSVCAEGSDVYETCETDDPEVTIDEVITVYTKPGMFGEDPVCSHSPLEEGWPLAATCSSVTAAVCADDLYCCKIAWDEACVARAQEPHIGF